MYWLDLLIDCINFLVLCFLLTELRLLRYTWEAWGQDQKRQDIPSQSHLTMWDDTP